MVKGRLKKDDLKLLYHAQPVSQHFSQPLFKAGDGCNIYKGDSVSFYVNGEHLPHNGTIDYREGIKLDCFNTLLNKWQYYEID